MTGWLKTLLGIDGIAEGEQVECRGGSFVLKDDVLRSTTVNSSQQQQTSDTFGFKWHKRETFESEAMRGTRRQWLIERYGDIQSYLPPGNFLLLDVGCGAAVPALELFGPVLSRAHYLGVDVSDAVDVAQLRCRERAVDAGFLQCDLNEVPLEPGTVDVIFSEGVLHHTDSTERALKNLAALVRPDGLFMFYVYTKKGPLREFADDYVRAALRNMSPQQAWEAVMPLTRLGKVLGELDLEIEVPEAIGVLDIPAGRVNLQRFFYWHVCKAFYRPDFTLDEMNHINFDWYAPANAFRQTPEQVRAWCAEADLAILSERAEEAGITVVARKGNGTCAA